MTLRPIEKITLTPGSPVADPSSFGPAPEARVARIADLWVDEDYQRDVSRKSFALIHKICAGFAWRRMKPPICVEDAGKLHVVDGQHTAIAAATLGLETIPVFVVRARDARERADAFVGHNQDRIIMSQLDIYRGQLAAGDRVAKDVERAMAEAGARFRTPNKFITPKIGDTGSVGIVKNMVKVRGFGGAKTVLAVLVDARRAPISAAELQAVDALIHHPTRPMSAEVLAPVILRLGDKGVQAAQVAAAERRVPVKVALEDAYRDAARSRTAA